MKINNWTKEDILKLSYQKGLTYSLQKRIVEDTDSFEEMINNLPEYIQGKFNNLSLFDNFDKVDRLFDEQMELLHKNSINYVTYWDERYPTNLKQVPQSPVVLYYKGDLSSNNQRSLSIVGTRKCSTYGRLTAEKFATEFAKNDVLIVSGLAYGIDTIAHRATMKADGRTIAVVACGIDTISPLYAEKLSDEIIDKGGAIISEYKCQTVARPGYFPQRNRIISGIGLATLIIESDTKGGSLITARFAIDQGREVFAVPGPVNSSKSAGCNKLIYDNLAVVALSPESVLHNVGLIDKIPFQSNKKKFEFKNSIENDLYELLSYEPMHIDQISINSGLDISEILVKLLEFEFKGLVRQLPGKYYIKE